MHNQEIFMKNHKNHIPILIALTAIFAAGCAVREPSPSATPSQPEDTAQQADQPADLRNGSVEAGTGDKSALPVSETPGFAIFDFEAGEKNWYTVDDDVMGGVSSSTVDISNSGVLTFSGNMSLENNGGFASITSAWAPMNLKGYDGTLIRVQGDGNRYRLRLRTTGTGREVTYNAVFRTIPGEWQEIFIPFDKMLPTYRGIAVNTGQLDPSGIASVGFMLSDNQPGDFSLKVEWIRVVSGQELQTF
jgi:monofunctional biosynthetic peptidoglycan transglycosylase